MEILLVVLAAVAALAACLAAFRRPAGNAEELAAVRNDLSILRETTQGSLQTIGNVFGQQLQATTQNVQTALAAVNSDVQNRLDAVTKLVSDRLNENVTAMSASTKAVTDSIANVQGTFSGLQKQVGTLGEQARQLSDLSKSIGELQHVLTAPKLRGGFGETQLESLLAEVFPREQFAVQHKFPSGEIADAVIFFPQGKVAIDSKFSLENFRRIALAETEADKKSARRDFLKDVRKRIDEIATKYIRPADGTLPFALMYVPAENVYYEAIIRDDDGNDLYSYCLQRRVLPVSPNSLYAYLQTILMGLNSMRVSQRAEAILRQIESLKIELEKFGAAYKVVGTHIRNASEKYNDSANSFGKVENRLQSLTALEPGSDEAQLSLGAGSGN